MKYGLVFSILPIEVTRTSPPGVYVSLFIKPVSFLLITATHLKKQLVYYSRRRQNFIFWYYFLRMRTPVIPVCWINVVFNSSSHYVGTSSHNFCINNGMTSIGVTYVSSCV